MGSKGKATTYKADAVTCAPEKYQHTGFAMKFGKIWFALSPDGCRCFGRYKSKRNALRACNRAAVTGAR